MSRCIILSKKTDECTEKEMNQCDWNRRASIYVMGKYQLQNQTQCVTCVSIASHGVNIFMNASAPKAKFM